MFVPYRTVGLVCSGEQQCLQSLGGEGFLTTGIGRGFQVWRMAHLSLALVSQQLPECITHVAAFRDVTFTATEALRIVVWRRARPTAALAWGSDGAPVVSLLHLKEVLLSLHEDGSLLVWDAVAAAREPAGSSSSSSSSSSGGGGGRGGAALPLPLQQPLARHALPLELGRPTALLHPDTYLNKVAIGLDSGSVLIFNFSTGRLIHECRVMPGCAVTALAQSPVADVVAVGGADGAIALYNLRADELITAFAHASGTQRITALAFSAGNALALPLLASAAEGGALALWDLDARALAALLPYAHTESITHLAFLPGQPTLLSAGGGDNALRQWALDRLNARPTLLRARSGHTAPPRRIRYFAAPGGSSNFGDSAGGGGSSDPASACEIVSAGADRRVRCFHTARDVLNVELSQGKGTMGASAAEAAGGGRGGGGGSGRRLPQRSSRGSSCSCRRRGCRCAAGPPPPRHSPGIL